MGVEDFEVGSSQHFLAVQRTARLAGSIRREAAYEAPVFWRAQQLRPRWRSRPRFERAAFGCRDRIAEGSCPRGRSDAGRASLFTFAGVKSEKNNIIRYIRIQIGHPGACDCVWGVGPRADVATCREPVSRTSETKQDPAAEVYLLGALGVQSVTSHPGTAKGHPAGRMVYKPFEEMGDPDSRSASCSALRCSPRPTCLFRRRHSPFASARQNAREVGRRRWHFSCIKCHLTTIKRVAALSHVPAA